MGSPISARDLRNRSINDVTCVGELTYWVEACDGDDGYMSLMVKEPGKEPQLALPDICDGASSFVGTKVYEYGGRAYDVNERYIVFSSAVSGRVYLRDLSDEAACVRPLTDVDTTKRYADFCLDPFKPVVYAVQEDQAGATNVMDIKHSIVAVDFDGTIRNIYDKADFVSSPTVSPDGGFLAFISWNAPAMPWTYTRLHVTKLDRVPLEVHTIVDVPDVAVCHPTWTVDGDLLHIDDASGWDTIYRTEGFKHPHHNDNPHLNWYHRIRTRSLKPIASDFAPLLWTLGRKSFAVYDADYIFSTWIDNGRRRCGMIRLDNGEREALPFDWEPHNSLDCADGRCVMIAHSDTEPTSIVEIKDGKVSVLASTGHVNLDKGAISIPEYLTWPTGDGQEAHGFYYAPRVDGKAVEGAAPLIVYVHGGPTSMASSEKKLEYLFWATRGFGVLVVNYRGSTGFGRTYQDALNGYWGIRDVTDCEDGVRFLIERGDVDATRVAIRGGSAGGFTTLKALTSSDMFSAGCSLYGVADLRMLDAQTHKFEANYLPALIGVSDDDDPRWEERSPLYSVDNIHAPLLLLQGEDDVIVPPNQAHLIESKLRERGQDVELHMYPDEGHGFMHDDTRVNALETELAFYRRVWGL